MTTETLVQEAATSKPVGQSVLDGYVNRVELAEQLKVKPRTISEWIARPDGLPHVKLGKAYFFRLADVTAWVEGRICVRNKTKVASRRNRK